MSTRCPKCHFENPDDTIYCGKCGTKLEVQAQSAGSEGIERISVTRTLETSPDELMRGSIFAGRYEVIEELGKGGMGRVYRIYDTKVQEDLALKLIHPEIAADKKVLERFNNELKVARKIVHKNVCRMYHLSEEKGTHYITMEYVAGEDLKSFIRRSGQLAVGTAIKIARQICEGLSEAHKSGIIHRDLKPGNIMIDKEGKVRIMDFGIARSLLGKGITSEGSIIGTPEYMSPEQVEGKDADQRSDIYALGIILFEMVTGRVPFEGETPFSVAFKHKTELPVAPKKFHPQLPEDLNRLILRCLEKAREKRYQTAEELLAELNRIEGDIPTAERLAPKRKTIVSKEVTIKFFPKKLIVPAICLFLIAVGLFFLKKSLFRKESPLPLPMENSIAVISFSNLTGDPHNDSLIKAVPNLLITKFEAMGFSYVATWEHLQDLLKQMDKDPNAPIDADTGIEVCRRDGVNALVVGSITKAGNIFATNIKVLDVKTKKSLASATSQGEGDDSILKTQIDELAGQITDSLDIGGHQTGISSLVSDVSTTSLEAYRFYLAGVEAFQNYHHSRARQHFLDALGIDPEFASAYLWLARSSRQLGLDEDGKESLEKALALVDRVNPKEKLYILAYHAIYAENNQDKGIQILRQLVAKYPKEKESHVALGSRYYSQHLYEESLQQFQAVIELDPDHGPALNAMTVIYRLKGDYERALDYAKQYVSAVPNEANPLDTLGYIYVSLGQFDLAIEQFKKALVVEPDFFSTLNQCSYTYALKEDYSEAIRWAEELSARTDVPANKIDGFLLGAFYMYWTGASQSALDTLEKMRIFIEKNRNQLQGYYSYDLSKFWSFQIKSWIYLARGDFERHGQELDQTLNFLPPEQINFFKALVEFDYGSSECLKGHAGAARERLLRMEKLLPEIKTPVDKEFVRLHQRLLRARILITEGSWDEAISLLDGFPLLFKFEGFGQNAVLSGHSVSPPEIDLAHAYEMKGDVDKAIQVLEHLVRFDPADKDFRLTPPKVYYDLGRMYEKTGQKAESVKNYEKFLDLWKQADLGIDEVENAGKRLAALKN